MRFRNTLVLVILTAILWMPSEPAASGKDDHRRWGVGWDDGIALRYRPSPRWGMGIRLDPRIRDEDNVDSMSGVPTGDLDQADEFAIGIGALVYREVRLGRWVALGPYAEIGFRYGETKMCREITDSYYSPAVYKLARNLYDRNWHVAIGLRPAFVIEERFVIETRLGLILTRRVGDDWYEETVEGDSPNPHEDERRHRAFDTWDFDAVGTNLGLGSAMKFIVYF